MAKKTIKPTISKVEGTTDITKIPELPIVKSASKIPEDFESLKYGRENGEKDEKAAARGALKRGREPGV